MTRAARPIGTGWWLVDGDVFGRDARRSLAELEAEHHGAERAAKQIERALALADALVGGRV